MRRKWIFLAPLALLAFIGFITIGGAIVQLLWNWLVPPLIGWRQVTFWQALGVLALSRILFGGFGLHGSGRSGIRRRIGERLEHMTPEERERFHERLREKWGFGRSATDSRGTEAPSS